MARSSVEKAIWRGLKELQNNPSKFWSGDFFSDDDLSPKYNREWSGVSRYASPFKMVLKTLFDMLTQPHVDVVFVVVPKTANLYIHHYDKFVEIARL